MIPLNDLFAFHVGGQTDFQLDYRVTVRAGGTPYGCLVQSVRELWKRFRGVRDDWFQRDICQIEIEELEQRMTIVGHTESFAGRRDAVSLQQKRLHLIELQKHIENDEREFVRFYSQAAAIWKHLGFDQNPPTPERLSELEAERQEHYARCRIALDLLANGRPLANTLEMIQCLPSSMRERIYRQCLGIGLDEKQARSSRERLVNWYQNFTPDIPEPLPLRMEDIRETLLIAA
jgi:hypothetical protein